MNDKEDKVHILTIKHLCGHIIEYICGGSIEDSERQREILEKRECLECRNPGIYDDEY